MPKEPSPGKPNTRRYTPVMMQVVLTFWVANRKVYGAHKLWKAARRAGHDIGHDQVGRLMRELGIEGVPVCERRCSRADPISTRCGHRTWSTATSRRRSRTSCG